MPLLKTIIKQNLSGKKVLFFFVLSNTVYLSMLFITIPETMGYANGMKLLDMMPLGYDINYIQQLFTTLGEAGRNTYLYSQIPLDLLYPGLFAISSILIIAFFLNKLNKLDTKLFYICLLPFIAGAADYCENFGIIKMLNTYPKISPNWAQMTNWFSVAKSMSTTLFFFALSVILIHLGIQSLKSNK